MAKSSVFEDVHLEWDGRRYTIKADRMMGAIAVIERHITLKELADYGKRETIPLAGIAQAYAGVLRYAGANVQDAQVYQGMFALEGNAKRELIIGAVQGLTMMMIPPDQFRGLAEGASGNLNRRQRRAAAKSSRKRSS